MYRGKLLRAAVLAGLSSFVGSSALANVDNSFTGATSGDYNDPSNWSLGHLPTNANNPQEDALINTSTGNIATISADFATSPTDFFVGRDAGSTGLVNHTAGTAANQNGNWMFIGTRGGNGTYNLTGAAAAPAGTNLTGRVQGSGSLNSSGRLYVGGDQVATGGTGLLNINTTGTVSSGNDFIVGGGDTGTGTVNLDAGSVSVSGWFMVGSDHGDGGTNHTQNGTFNMAGGSIDMPGNADNRVVVGMAGATGKFVQTGGSVTLTDTLTQLFIGNGTGNGHASDGSMTVSGGSVTTNNWTAVGRDGGKGRLTISGGTFTKTGANQFLIGSDATGSDGQVTVSGTGSLSINNDLNMGVGGDNNKGVVQQDGGSVSIGGNLNLTDGANGKSATYNLAGGVLDMHGGSINNGGGAAAFNFTGGTLKNAGNVNVPVNQTGGTLAPGASPGTTNFTAGFILGIGGHYEAELQSGSTTSDTINVTGGNGLTLAGNVDPVALGGALTPGTVYTIATYSSLSGTFANAPLDDTSYTLGGQLYTIDYNAGGNNITLTVAVPEPTTLGLLGFAGAALGLRRRRRLA